MVFVSETWIEFITSWFTPKILFCAMNIMIGTIFVSSNLKSRTTKHQDINNDHDHHHHHHHRNYNQFPFQLMRPPSLLERVRSFDFSLFPAPSHDPNHTQLEPSPSPSPSPSLLQRVKSIKLSRIYGSSCSSPAAQTEPEQSPTVVVPSEKKMMKSESMKAIPKVTDYDEVINQIRPATTRESSKNDSLGLLDDEVDAKADDFIQRFRQELKLQRLESLLKYKEMLKSGSSRN